MRRPKEKLITGIAAPLVPQLLNALVRITGDSLEAQAALGRIGPAAACALPALVLCLEKVQSPSSLQNIRFAIEKLGRAPRRAIPYLGRLLYHPNPVVALNAAKLIKDSKLLPPEVQAALTDDGLVGQLQTWWETGDSAQSWTDGDTPPGGKQAGNGPTKP